MKSKSLLFVLLIALFFGCKKKTTVVDAESAEKYVEYVSEYTNGIISTNSPIQIVLAQPVEAWKGGKELNANILEISPSVNGTLKALNDKTIVFAPKGLLKQDTQYTFQLNLKEIYKDVPEDLEEFAFFVNTIKQDFSVTLSPMQAYSKEYQYIDMQVRTADEMSLETAKKLVKGLYKGKELPIKYNNQPESGTQFQFKLDSIKRYKEDEKLVIEYSGKSFDIDTEGKIDVVIPGKNNFSILDVTVEQTQSPVVKINFSDPLKKGQNFKGLVLLENDENPRFSIKGNTLRVYPSDSHSGSVLLEVFDGIQSVDGVKLKKKFEERIAFEQIKPQVRVLSNATILPSSTNLKVNFEAVNLKAVDVKVFRIYENNVLQFLQVSELNGSNELRRVARPIGGKKLELQDKLTVNNGKWQAHALDLTNLITPEKGAIYRVEFSFKPQYSLYTCDDTNFDSDEEEKEESFDEEAESSYWDYSEDYYNGDYDWSERENPCHTSYYRNKKASVNILATDIGVTIKKGLNNSYFVATADLVTTKPIVGAKVTFYNYQQHALGTVTTSAEGVSFFDAKSIASFAVAEHKGQKTYVKLNDGNALSVSKFKVAGVKLQKGIKGYIFAERGVWRPGDNIFLSFVLNDNANKLPANHPVKLELLDPYNKVVHREIKTNSLNNFYNFPVQTDDDVPTGDWLVKVSVGGAEFTKTIKIETIKPNRLKIKNDFGADILVGGKQIKGTMEVKWLHGAIAKNLNTDIAAKFNTKTTAFKNYPGYVFDDPSRSFSAEEQMVYSGKIDAEGKANFSINPQLEGNPPGMLQAAFVTKVYENGGDFSTDVFTKPYSPYNTYIGLNAPKGDKSKGMLLTDVKHNFEVVSVDENGKPKAAKNLKVTIYKIQWRWWWDTSEDNLTHYGNSGYRNKVYEKTITTNSKGKGNFEFELKYPDWGRYLVRVEDEDGGHATGKAVYIDWPGWAGKSKKNDPSAATMLLFSSDKEKYNVGETATFTFPSSENGRALVTVENGSEVLESIWVETEKGETKFTMAMTKEYTPNVFIHISLLQPHASTLNDLPIRMYGVIPISVENKETKLQPKITMPDVLRPEETVTVNVGEVNGKAMTYTIAIVDEGLLDLTRFKTPNPWGTFYANEALGVKTWDIYDDVIGAFGGRINQVFAIGGDDEMAGAKNKKANRFEPMVVHLGPFKLEKGKTKAHKIKIPKYVGSVRTMVVAADAEKEAYGSEEKTTPVRKPLMILASLPRKITPGESVILPVTVFAMEKKVKNVKIKIKDNEAFTIEAGNTKSLTFDQPDEKMAYFVLKVSDFKGIGKVIVEASGGGEKASFEIPIDVVNPNPVTADASNYVVEPNSSQTIDLQTFGVAGTNSAAIEVSTLPAMNFNGRMQYLIRYPHGCVEQTTSGAFPQLFLADIFDIPKAKKEEVQKNVEMAVNRLAGFQTNSGGLSYWQGQSNPNDWGTSYAGHFMLEAEKKGYVLPIGFKSKWITYQKNVAKQFRNSGRYTELTQAYRLYTLALAGSADVASMNRLQESKDLSNQSKLRLAAAYALIGQKSVATNLMNSAVLEFTNDRHNNSTFGSSERNRAMALETMVLMQNKVKSQQLALTVAERLNSKDYMSTQSTAYSLLAMAKFANLVGGKGIKATIKVNGKSETISTSKTLANRTLTIKRGNNSITLKNNEGNTLYVTLVNSGKLPVGEERAVQNNLAATVVYKSRNGSTIDPSKIEQGTDFVAEVTLKNTTGNSLKNVALTEVFPSGWEIVNTRFTDFGNFAENNVTHTDLRDDRANFYFDLRENETKSFRILLNASYLGTYYLPGVQAEAMYDHDYLVRTKGNWVEVVK
ncbi:MG2 domain-containing protein [Cellulophaga sp. 20_2_10]|uniref:alpha-2-macroglobulin family protein n=1 Tax=Cellulophaga sp. 20_2_10 TaxID=2942476 RepID=UPI00201AC3BF|nr:MG2 domain-containing protein [Cellulophaga sp. 20_2_10]MCL5246575.1 MG2 domain-containing protein [Cellulophaga sp. 20_2_10]